MDTDGTAADGAADGGTAGPSATMLLDIAPTTAFIQSSAVFSLAASRGMRYVFMGGEDGFVRKYDFEASMKGQTLLTSGQRHMLPDSVTKAGVLSAFWENEQLLMQSDYKVSSDGYYTPLISPVYSLACQAEALWLASGLESGDIRLQSTTYGEIGQVLAYLRGHTKTVSDLKLSAHESRLLSGSWDKSVACWDLERGVAINKYRDLSSQVSSVDWQAGGALPVERVKEEPKDDEDDDKSLFGSDNEDEDADKPADGANDDSGNASPSGQPTADPADSFVFLSSTFNGRLNIWDIRQKEPASTLLGSQAPPWCISACFSFDGNHVFAGRRNACVEDYDLRACSQPLRSLKFPSVSGSVSCVTAMPDNQTLLCASYDNVRLYDLQSTKKTPFTIIPGHHGSMISRMLVDASGRYIVSATGGRGWTDTAIDSALAYEVGYEG